jgi:hypothetical protein
VTAVRRIGLFVAVALAVGACGGGGGAVDRADDRRIELLEADALPPTIRNLSVSLEDIDELREAAKRPYLEAAALYSLREEEKLQATLQIGRFADDAEYEDEDWRLTLLNTIGGGAPRELRIGEHQVFVTSGERQFISIWFAGRHLFILSSREDYTEPRALLRDALELEL